MKCRVMFYAFDPSDRTASPMIMDSFAHLVEWALRFAKNDAERLRIVRVCELKRILIVEEARRRGATDIVYSSAEMDGVTYRINCTFSDAEIRLNLA